VDGEFQVWRRWLAQRFFSPLRAMRPAGLIFEISFLRNSDLTAAL